MTNKRAEPRIAGIIMSDGLDAFDPIEHDAKNAPNSSDESVFREYYEAEFNKMVDERDAFVEGLLREHFTGPLTIEGLHKLLISAPEMSLYYAAKYMLHRKLIDRFREQGHTLSANREIYLLGATWAEAKFMVNYRDHAHHGRASTAKLDNARTQRNAEARDEARRRYAAWQRAAREIWRRHPDWSKDRVAAQIKKEHPEIEAKQGTIAKQITPTK